MAPTTFDRPGCGKHRFTTRAEAKAYAARIRKGKAGGKHQRPYRCDDPVCMEAGFWHLTSGSAQTTEYYRDREEEQRLREQRNARRNQRNWYWPW